jgi:ADP-ribose pyrophosphatase
MEETGYCAVQMIPLGALLSDTGRLENKTWGFFAPDVQPVGGTHMPEPGVQRVLVPKSEILNLILRGEFNHALNLAVVMLCVARMGLEWLVGKEQERSC